MITPKEHTKRLCIIPLCKNERFDLVHKFPMDNQRAEEWRRAINIPEINSLPLHLLRKRTICSKHFRREDYKNIESRSLNKTAVPSLHFTENDDKRIVAVTEKCKESNLIGMVKVAGDRLMECKIFVRNHGEPVTPVSNNGVTTTIISNEGPFPKYRLVQSNQVQVIDTDLNSIPIANTINETCVRTSLVPLTNVTNIEDSITVIDQLPQINFLTTKHSVNHIHNVRIFGNDVIQQLKSPYIISKYNSS